MLRPYLNFDSAWKAVTQPSRYFVQEIPIYEAKKTDLGKEFAQSGEIDGQNAEKEVLHEAIGIKEVQEEDPGTEARNRQKRRLEAEEWEECIWLIRQQHASKNDEFAQKLVNLVHQKGNCIEPFQPIVLTDDALIELIAICKQTLDSHKLWSMRGCGTSKAF